MDLINYKFSGDEIENLQNYRDNQSDSRLKSRFIALLMISNNTELKDISFILGKNIRTIENWFKQYCTKGIDSLNSFHYKPKRVFLKVEQIQQLIKWVTETNPSKIKEIKKYIKEQFGVEYSIEGVRLLLKKNGLKFLKPKIIPGNPPSEEEQKKKWKNIKI